ncbi:hypothetical protein HN446_05260 [bacterium]|jgi:guanylate kinase|nr:hypothetical protein [bacterium]
MSRKGKLFIVSAPSGTGKTTLILKIIEQYGPYINIERVVTYTTKEPHKTEQHGIDYNFLSKKEFEEKIAQDFFIEWSDAYGDCYGSPKDILHELEFGKSYFLIIDQVGGYNIVKEYPNSVLIWLTPADFNILHRRISGRERDSKEIIESRMLRAKQEVLNELKNSIYKYHVVAQDLETSIKKFIKILKKELQL